ncbi:MAG: hypothetical protein SH809_00345 [Rhodothermales bacterium]|nr:hypothetical protein [Rhodothermales bacterium]
MPLSVETHLRRFQLVLAAAVCLGVIAELALIGHTEGFVQWVPILFSSLALPVFGLAYARPSRGVLFALRVGMVVLIVAGGYGLYEHFEHNLEFELEIQPNATFADVWLEALRGASPALAPGALSLAGLLGLAATYRHPALQPRAAAATAVIN